MTNKTFNKLRNHGSGPGGWNCPCCNPFNCHPRKGKKLSIRRIRRTLKVMTRKEIDNG